MTLTPEQRERYAKTFWNAESKATRFLEMNTVDSHMAGTDAVALAAQRDIVLTMIADREELVDMLIANGIGRTFIAESEIVWLKRYLPAAPSPQEDV